MRLERQKFPCKGTDLLVGTENAKQDVLWLSEVEPSKMAMPFVGECRFVILGLVA